MLVLRHVGALDVAERGGGVEREGERKRESESE